MRRMLALVIVVLMAGAVAAAGGQTKYRGPRTDDGRPDLQGVWNYNTAVPLQRPVATPDKKVFTKEEFEARRAALRDVLGLAAKFAPVEAIGLDWMDNTLHVEDMRTSLITYPANGRLPATQDGVRRVPQPEEFITSVVDARAGGPPPNLTAALALFQGGKKDSYTDFMPSERCLFDASVPLVPAIDDNHVEIIQGPDHLVLISDFWRRIVALDGKPPVADALRSWPGTSRGHWEGDTLVIETRNFIDGPPSFAGAGTARDKAVTERISRTGPSRLDYSATVVDTKTFKDRIELAFPMALVNASIYEGACHEGNYSMRNSLSAARKADEAARSK